MAWIESHQQLRDHPKVARLSRLLQVSRPQAVGMLHFLWWWALDHAEDGDLTDFDAFDIADAAGWEGEPEQLVDALLKCGPGERSGFLDCFDGQLMLHDWLDYAGKLIESRRHHAGQKRKHRELYNDRQLCADIRDRDRGKCRYCGKQVNWKDRRGGDGATYDYVNPDGPTSLDNIVVACRACNAGKNQRTPDEAGYKLLQEPDEDTQVSVDGGQESTPTVPDLTQPNRTEQNKTSTTKAKRATQFPDGWKPNDNHRKIAAEVGADADDQAQRFEDHHVAKGSTFKDWDRAFNNWLRNSASFGTTGKGSRTPKSIEDDWAGAESGRAQL